MGFGSGGFIKLTHKLDLQSSGLINFGVCYLFFYALMHLTIFRNRTQWHIIVGITYEFVVFVVKNKLDQLLI